MTDKNDVPPQPPAEIYRQAMHLYKTAYTESSNSSLDMLLELADLAKDGPVSTSEMKEVLTRYIAKFKEVHTELGSELDRILGTSSNE